MGGTTQSIVDSQELRSMLALKPPRDGSRIRAARLLGMLTKDNQVMERIPEGSRSLYSLEKWGFLLDAPFVVGSQCCRVMKKKPSHQYQRKTGRKVITAQMASESRLRTQAWVKNGCNAFNAKTPISNPMAFWFEQDVLLYLYINKIPIAKPYGEIIVESGDPSLENAGIFDKNRPVLKTTGCSRTGCMFCGFGCHLEKPGEGRFERLKVTHPKIYEYLFKPESEGGLGYKEIIDWINEHGGTHIRY